MPTAAPIDDHGRRLEGLALGDRIPEENLLHQNRQQRRPQGQHPRRFQRLPLQPAGDLEGTIDDNADGGSHQRQRHEQRRQRLELPMPVIMRIILRFRADAHENQHDQVRQEIRQGLYRVRHHGGAPRHDPGDKLERQQHQVSDAAQQGDFRELVFACHGPFCSFMRIYSFSSKFPSRGIVLL